MAGSGLLLVACGSRDEIDTRASHHVEESAVSGSRSAPDCVLAPNRNPLVDAGGCPQPTADTPSPARAAEVPEELQDSLVYLSHYGTGVVSLTPYEGGSVGTPIPLGPHRGRDWGVARANVSLVGLSPDEAWALVCLRGEHGDWLHALALDGSSAVTPTKLAETCPAGGAPQQQYYVAFHPQGTRLAFSTETAAWVLTFDGSTLPDLVQVAAAAPETTVERLWWADDRILYQQRDSAYQVSLHSVADDGSEVDSPVLVSASNEFPSAILAGQSDIVTSSGSRISTLDGSATRLTPSDEPRFPELMAISEPQGRAVFRLWSNDAPTRTLISVSLDGSEADAPISLLGEHDEIEKVTVLPDGEGLIVQVRNNFARRQLYEVGWDDGLPVRLLTDSSDADLHAVSADGQWLYGCNSTGVVRMHRDEDSAGWEPTSVEPAELALDVPGITAPGPRYVTCDTHTLPNTGATHTSNHVVAKGVVSVQERFGRSAVFLRTPLGATVRLTAERADPITEAVLPPGSAHVYYRDVNGWHAADLDGGNADADQVVLAATATMATADLVSVVGRVPLFSLDTLYSVTDGRTLHVLDDSWTGGLAVITSDDSVVSGNDGQLFDIPVDGGEPTLLLEEATFFSPADVIYDRARDQVIARVGDRLLAMARDGSEKSSPRVLLEALPADYHIISTLYGDAVVLALAHHSAVAHPYGAALVALDGSDAAAAREVQRPGLFLYLGFSQQAISPPIWGPFLSPDEAWVLHQGNTWELLPSDERSEQAGMPLEDAPIGMVPLSRTPHGRWLLTHGGPLWRLPLSPAEYDDPGAVRLTPALALPDSVHWLDAGERLVFETKLDDTAQILLANADGGNADNFTVLAGSSTHPAKLQGVTHDSSGIIYSTPTAPASKIYSLTPGEEPLALTQDTDTEERFVGWVRK